MCELNHCSTLFSFNSSRRTRWGAAVAAAATAASEDGTDGSQTSGAAKWNERDAGTGNEWNAMMSNGIDNQTEQKRDTPEYKTPQLFILMVCTSTPEKEKSTMHRFWE